MEKPELVHLLNHLIVTAKDGAGSLRAAGDEAYHPILKQSLYEFAQFYLRSAEELQAAVRELGGAPREIGSFGNTLHRTWLHLKLTALGRDETVLLQDLARDEEELERRFSAAALEDSDPKTRRLIEGQYQTALRYHARLDRLQRQLRLH